KIFSCIKRLKEKENKETVCNVLKGNQTPDVEERQLDKIKTFGAMSDTAESVINEHIDYFTERGYITVSPSGELALSEKCSSILYGERQLRREEQKRRKKPDELRVDAQLFVKLKKLRGECARKASVPDFIIFTDATLLAIARQKPLSLDEFSKIPGVSFSKLQKYGIVFIKAINKHCNENIENKKIN
ncbi:MAG: HRDC domain-containing protein, partial [Clostridia bacterium]|nr:HRDC domain-containing protein [Clostridia bacterium]